MATESLTQSGFSEAQRLEALSLRTRMQNGETIPLEELRRFILSADADLQANRVKVNKPPIVKQTDVDFF